MPNESRNTSPFVRSCVSRIDEVGDLALDLPCGFGRHSQLLVDAGFHVIAADLDFTRLVVARKALSASDRVGFLQLDATSELPLFPASFDLVLVVHPPYTNVVLNAAAMVRSGGHLIFETFGKQGENWRRLPRPGEIADALSQDFEQISYVEQIARRVPPAVVARGWLRRR